MGKEIKQLRKKRTLSDEPEKKKNVIIYGLKEIVLTSYVCDP